MGDPREKEFVDAGHTSEEKAVALSEQERSAFTSTEGETVDVETIKKFIDQLDEQAGLDARHYEQLVAELRKKRAKFADVLDRAPALDEGEVRFIVRNVFATRGRTDDVLEMVGPETFGQAVADLLTGDDERGRRFDRFCVRLDGLDEPVRWSLAAELLHFSDPEANPLWARWMWNPASQTGAVPLMTMADVDLTGDSPGEVYEQVAGAVASLDEHKAEMGFDPDVLSGPFGTDVAMATVHAVYTYLVLGMRMTKEFTQAIPDHPEYIRRLLGIQELHEELTPDTDGPMPGVPNAGPGPAPGQPPGPKRTEGGGT